MNRIDKKFNQLKKEKKKAFIAYITAGDPSISATEKIAGELVSSGVDIIELGIPFSDPLADGPTIQKAVKRSLDAGFKVKDVLKMAVSLRKRIDIPLVFMTYYNIVLNYGVKTFVKDAKKSGIDGIIVPDLPLEESEDLFKASKKENFHVIMLAAPTTPLERFKKIAARSKGFIYYVSLTGVTGARKELSQKLNSHVRMLKKVTTKPICVGFGVSSAKQAGGVAKAADGVIVGSAIIKIIEKNLNSKSKIVKAIGAFSRSIAKVVH